MAVSSNPEGRESSISNYYSYVNAFVGLPLTLKQKVVSRRKTIFKNMSSFVLLLLGLVWTVNDW